MVHARVNRGKSGSTMTDLDKLNELLKIEGYTQNDLKKVMNEYLLSPQEILEILIENNLSLSSLMDEDGGRAFTSREKSINSTHLPQDTHNLILSLLGLGSKCLSEVVELFDNDENIQLDKGYVTKISPEMLANLPSFSINYERVTMKTSWVKNCDVMDNADEYEKTMQAAISPLSKTYFIPDNFFDYTKVMGKVIDTILPTSTHKKDKDNKGLVPVTILLPCENPENNMVSGILGYESNWTHYQIKNESIDGKKGLRALTTEKNLHFGLRLFLAFKELGLARTSQSVQNNSRIFLEILNSTQLKEQVYLIDQENFRCFAKQSKLKKPLGKDSIKENNLKKSSNIDTLTIPFGRTKGTSYFYSFKNIDEQEAEGTAVNCADHEGEKPDKKVMLDGLVLATLSSSIKPLEYKKNKLKLDKGNPAPEGNRKLRSILPDILSKSCGTAITFYIEKTDNSDIRAPLLLLPEEFNDACLELKNHKPKDPLTGANGSKSANKSPNIFALTANAKGICQPYMRLMIPIVETSIHESKDYDKIFKGLLNISDRD